MVFELLTDRQADVLWLMCDGWTDQEIAEDLGITPATARQYRSNVRQRLAKVPIPEVCHEIEEEQPELAQQLRSRDRVKAFTPQ
jgi:DNA-binding NarL/FixJ family response regulator